MTKVMKKLGAALLSFALVLTMMPFLAMPAAAATDVFTVTLNDATVGTITDEWMQDNNVGPQIFPSLTKKGSKYVIAEGPALSSIFNETIGISDIGELPNALIEYKATAEETAKNPISGRDLANAVSVIKTVDEKGAEVDFDSTANVFVAKYAGASDVEPVLAFRESKAYATYDDAKAALDDESWKSDATDNVQPYVGGNLVKEADLQVKKDGAPIDVSVNFTGKFVLTGKSIINIKLDAPTGPEKGSFTLKVGENLKITPKYTTTEASVIYGEGTYCTWESDPNYLTDDPQAEGVFKAVAPGKTKVLFKVEKDVGQDTIEVATLGEWDITISAPVAPAKPKPAKPASLKATNVKKKTAKLVWGKAANAEGYEVYRSLKKTKGFKKVATVTNTTYKNKKLKKGKTYYFKVKSYNVVNGKKVYSAFSKVVKVKIKK